MSEFKDQVLTEVHDELKPWEKALEFERSIAPLVDIFETENEFVLKANMPGVSKDDVHLQLEEGTLTIFGKVNFNEDLKKKYILHETLFANYSRSFKLSDSIDGTKIDAKYVNGQLIVNLPKHDKVKPRIININ